MKGEVETSGEYYSSTVKADWIVLVSMYILYVFFAAVDDGVAIRLVRSESFSDARARVLMQGTCATSSDFTIYCTVLYDENGLFYICY